MNNNEVFKLIEQVEDIYTKYKNILVLCDIKDNSVFFDKLEIFYTSFKESVKTNIFLSSNIINSLKNLYSLVQYLTYTIENKCFNLLNIQDKHEDYSLRSKSIFKQFRSTVMVDFRISLTKNQIPNLLPIIKELDLLNSYIKCINDNPSRQKIYDLIIVDTHKSNNNTNKQRNKHKTIKKKSSIFLY
jgi:hypothetical protein